MSAARATLIYDGNCGFCRRWVERVRRWDRRGRLEMVPYQTAELESRFPGVSRADCVERIHLVDESGAVRSMTSTVALRIASARALSTDMWAPVPVSGPRARCGWGVRWP